VHTNFEGEAFDVGGSIDNRLGIPGATATGKKVEKINKKHRKGVDMSGSWQPI